MSDIVIRPLCLSDCEKIGPLLREIWLDAYEGIQTDEELLAQSHRVHSAEQIAKEIEVPNTYSVVAMEGEKIIGHARSDLNDGVVDIFRLFILREYYGRGLGRQLLGEVESYFDSARIFQLGVFEENKRAVDFYLSQGYEITKRASEVQTEGRDVYHLDMQKLREGQNHC